LVAQARFELTDSFLAVVLLTWGAFDKQSAVE
jgi:hypothetical protein